MLYPLLLEISRKLPKPAAEGFDGPLMEKLGYQLSWPRSIWHHPDATPDTQDAERN